MQFRGYTSLYAYCAYKRHEAGNNRNYFCPLLNFASNNVLAPNNGNKSSKILYSRVIRSNSKTTAGRVSFGKVCKVGMETKANAGSVRKVCN